MADAMSRLCRNTMIDQPREYSEKYILSSIMIEKHGRNLMMSNIEELAKCTTQKLATSDLNVHLNVSRICKILESFSDSTSDIS